MREVAEGVWLLDGFPRNVINVYLVDDILVDAATRFAKRRIMRQIRGRKVTTHVLTHGHGDHQGASHAICTTLNIPLWCGAADADGVSRGDLSELIPQNLITRIQEKTWQGPAHAVTRRLHEGDVIGEWQILDVPGHSPGHIALWRERDRVLIAGDVFNSMNLLTMVPGLYEPPTQFTVDPAENRRSIRKLAALNPHIICVGHGPPVTDPAKFQAFVERLPSS